MKKMIALFGFLLSVGCFAQTEVSAYIPGTGQDGITYFLPKTEIKVEVEAVKYKYTPGEFCKYADRYLRLTGISDKEDEHWEIKNIKVSSVGVPDVENIYTVKVKDKTIAPFLELTGDGMIMSINRTPQKRSVPASVLTPAVKKPRINARDFMTEEILMASSSAKMAELVAKEIYNIRESKNAIIRGQADNMPKDGESLKLMLAGLEEQEQAMLDLFSGTTEEEFKNFTVTVIPDKDIRKDILFRFSRKLGIVGKNDLAGAPIYISLTNQNTVPVPEMEKGKKKDKKKMEGIVYNIPGKAMITIFNTNKTYFEGELPVTQFGTQEVLTNNLFNKKTTTQVIFNPQTGSVMKLEKENE